MPTLTMGGSPRGQSLRRHLPAAEKDRIDVESVLLEQPFFFSHPNMALRESQRRVAQADFLEFLADDGSGRT